ncbi:MAG: Dioxygenase related to 2-nitropropane dioxygenase [Betaproteobacteria bacterium]|nr:Dioxygenase related to 2-nitropropane dioxygenase [Betaproteobacteria bacterium]
MQPVFKTRITELYGIRLPVIASGLMWLATPEYVGAAVNAGLMGFMTAASFKNVDALRAGIQRCREITGGKPFGVNIMIRTSRDGTDRVTPLIDAVIDEGVRFVETAGHNPEAYIKRFKDAGIKVLHKVPGVRYAKKAESLGVDAVTVVGAEAGGHPGVEPVGTMVAAVAAARAIKIPLIVAGGIGTGDQLVAALALGADGVAMGTRFLVSEEVWADRRYKERLVKAGETDTTLLLQSMRNTQRALKTEHVSMIQQIEKDQAGDTAALLPHIMGTHAHAAYTTGDYEKAMLSCGQGVVFADKIEPFAAIVDRIEAEARATLTRLDSLHAQSAAGK